MYILGMYAQNIYSGCLILKILQELINAFNKTIKERKPWPGSKVGAFFHILTPSLNSSISRMTQKITVWHLGIDIIGLPMSPMQIQIGEDEQLIPLNLTTENIEQVWESPYPYKGGCRWRDGAIRRGVLAKRSVKIAKRTSECVQMHPLL